MIFKMIIIFAISFLSLPGYAASDRSGILVIIEAETPETKLQATILEECLKNKIKSSGNYVADVNNHDYILHGDISTTRNRLINTKSGILVFASFTQKFDSDLYSYMFPEKYRRKFTLATSGLYQRHAFVIARVGSDLELPIFCGEINDFISATLNSESVQLNLKVRKELEMLKREGGAVD